MKMIIPTMAAEEAKAKAEEALKKAEEGGSNSGVTESDLKTEKF